MAVGQLLASAAATLAAYWAFKAFQFLARPLFSTLRDLPGPSNDSWLYGNFREVLRGDPCQTQQEWLKRYGPTFRFKGIFQHDRLFTIDHRALTHILSHSTDYEKPPPVRRLLSHVLANGVLVAEGEEHRKQRRVMNPGFGPVQIRNLSQIFVDTSLRLRATWSAELERHPERTARIDVLAWLSRATLDIIGLAGFNYNFDALNYEERPNELNEAFETMFKANEELGLFQLLQIFVPILQWIPTDRNRKVEQARLTMTRIGRDLVAQKKAAVLADAGGSEKEIEKNSLRDRDLLSLLVRANTAVDLPEAQRMTDQDVVDQIPTFFAAGHETTSTGTTWCLFALACNPTVQRKLRAELLTVTSDSPDMDELQALRYLDGVVRETLRLHPPVPHTFRRAMRKDTVPLEVPVVDRKGMTHTEILVREGQEIYIPIRALNRAPSIWGLDAGEFRPERWEETMPDAVSNNPGVWGNVLSFLDGSHACIGYRFALVEMKALLFTLVRAFEFELAVRPEEVLRRSTVVTRPVVRGEEGNQLPLIVKRYTPQP